MPGLVIIGFDGSPDAEQAIDVAAGVLKADSAMVVTAWHLPIAAGEMSLPPVGAPTAPSLQEEDDVKRNAAETAKAGAARATAAGFDAEPGLQHAAGPNEIAKVLLDTAEQRDADLVVVGRRGMSRIRSVLLGSVSEAAVRDGRRPVLVVPGPATD
jgi:nucleotide-binding universal stress UspA family protein